MTRFKSIDELPERYRAQARRQAARVKPVPPPGGCSEKAWQSWVEGIAKTGGWTAYHTHDSRHSEGGFPDLVLVRAETDAARDAALRLAAARAFEDAIRAGAARGKGGRLVIAELKTDKGKLSAAQRRWLALLALVTPDVFVWRPRDWLAVWERLA